MPAKGSVIGHDKPASRLMSDYEVVQKQDANVPQEEEVVATPSCDTDDSESQGTKVLCDRCKSSVSDIDPETTTTKAKEHDDNGNVLDATVSNGTSARKVKRASTASTTSRYRGYNRRAPPAPAPYPPGFYGEFSTEAEEPEPPSEGDFIKYQNVYVNQNSDDDVLYSTVAFEPIVIEHDALVEDRRAVFDVVTTFCSVTHYDRYSRPAFKQPPSTTEKAVRTLVIRSTAILQALRTVVEYYPGVDLSTDVLRVKEPFCVLVHHYEELKSYREQHKPAGDNQGVHEKCNDEYRHLGLLLEYLDSQVMADVVAERKRHEKGLVTYDMLWVLFKPGEDAAVYNVEDNSKGGLVNRDGAVIAKVSGGPSLRYRERWCIALWSLHYDGKFIRQKRRRAWIDPFIGETELARLEVIPVSMATATDGGMSLNEYLTTQGRSWYAQLKPACMHHEGEVLDFPYHQVSK